MKHTPNEDEIDEVDADDESEDDLSPLLTSTPETHGNGEETKRTAKRDPKRAAHSTRAEVVVRKDGRRRR